MSNKENLSQLNLDNFLKFYKEEQYLEEDKLANSIINKFSNNILSLRILAAISKKEREKYLILNTERE
jgi:hypothetical protein